MESLDVSKLSPEDQAFHAKYGRLPPKKKPVLKGGDRKFFDSGDYAMSKAGKGSSKDVGRDHPSPEHIPHSVPTKNSEVQKESGLTKQLT